MAKPKTKPHLNLLSSDDLNKKRKCYVIKKEKDLRELLLDGKIEMGARIELTSSKLFFKWMTELSVPNEKHDSPHRNRYYFRGERTCDYRLIPSLLRDKQFETLHKIHIANNPLELQQKLLDRYKRYTQHLIHADPDFDAPIIEDFDTLCLAQHYGLPTLLIDWTLNPYVASYFACNGVSRTLLEEKLHACKELDYYLVRVWVMRLRLPKERLDQTIHLENREQAEYYNRYLHAKGQVPDGPKIVVPLVFTRRISGQVGRFIYCGYMQSEYDTESLMAPSLLDYSIRNHNSAPWDRLYSLDIRFPANLKSDSSLSDDKIREAKRIKIRESIKEMMNRLEFMGFHSGRLFPDLGGWANYLAQGNL